jgi:CBS domain-containing protein
VTVEANLPVRQVVDLMGEEKVGTVVVVEGTEPVGLLSDRDIALHVLIERLDAGVVRARELMHSPVVTIPEATSLAEAADVLQARGADRLPVVDEQGKVVGMIGSDDLLGLLSQQLAGLARVIAHQRPTEQLESELRPTPDSSE